MNKIILAFIATGLLITASCSKNNDNPSTVAQDNLQLDLKKSTDATNVMIDIHKTPANGHTLCFAQEKIYHQSDSLYSLHFYEYNHEMYTQHVSGHGTGHMNEHGEFEGEMNGMDSIEYHSNLNPTHKYHHTDSLMYQSMMNYNLQQYMPQNVQTCYDQMQLMRNNHAAIHKLHY